MKLLNSGYKQGMPAIRVTGDDFKPQAFDVYPPKMLAAFFEEQGSVTGLLDAVSNAAEWDEQISEGKSLSEREEAVLQALELLTRNAEDITWIKGTDYGSGCIASWGGQPTRWAMHSGLGTF